jgi:DNA polymerase III delta prime subunit
LVPSPNVAEDHQTKNAMSLVNKKAAILVRDDQAKANLIKEAIALVNNSSLQPEISKNCGLLAMPNSTNIIANEVKRPFTVLSAISAGVKDIREVIEKARFAPRTILFIDEIHRFNKSQQDALLGAVEKGTITLIGATTENPSFEVNSALLSRCQVYTLKSLNENELILLVEQALKKDTSLRERKITLQEHQALLNISDGDARKLLNLIDFTI